jgi:hypothetical protein
MISAYDAAGSSLPRPQTNTVAAVKEAPKRNQAANHASVAQPTGTFRPLVSPSQQMPSAYQPTGAYLPPSVYQPPSASVVPKPVSYAGGYQPLAKLAYEEPRWPGTVAPTQFAGRRVTSLTHTPPAGNQPAIQNALQTAFQQRLDAVQISTGSYLPTTGQPQ